MPSFDVLIQTYEPSLSKLDRPKPNVHMDIIMIPFEIVNQNFDKSYNYNLLSNKFEFNQKKLTNYDNKLHFW